MEIFGLLAIILLISVLTQWSHTSWTRIQKRQKMGGFHKINRMRTFLIYFSVNVDGFYNTQKKTDASTTRLLSLLRQV
jgi:hypothetical protein